MTTTRFTDARIVLEDAVVRGTLVVTDGRVAAVDPGPSRAAGDAVDCGGDLLIPGLVELHTDNLERHLEPRPGVDWPHDAAILAHDRELAGCGITTVFDALRVGSVASPTGMGQKPYARALATEIAAVRAAGGLRIDHRLHLRAEICSQTLPEELDAFGAGDRVGLVSLMDHTPGQRQFTDVSKFQAYFAGRYGLSDVAFERYRAELVALRDRVGDAHEAAAVAAGRRLGAALASHDDTTRAQVAASVAHGVALAEFPTSHEAASACREAGVAVMMGAPNVIRGGSHSGNASALDLAGAGLLDILSSDYVPAALLSAVGLLAQAWDDLPRAIATVTAAPASAAGLADRGRIAPGLRADLVRVATVRGALSPVGTWVEGRRVA